MKKDILQYENAQEMAVLHPETFKAPSKEQLDKIKVGDCVKVCVKVPKDILDELDKIRQDISKKLRQNRLRQDILTRSIILPESERFWVEITKIEDDYIEGKVSNDLVCLDLKYQELINFKKENIYSLFNL